MLVVASTATMLPACKTVRQLPPTVAEHETVTVTVRDTTVTVKPDTAAIEALLKCSEDNRLLLLKLSESPGERVKANVQLTPIGDGTAKLYVECAADSLRKELQLRDREIERLRETTNTVLVPKQLSWLQVTLMAAGALSIMLIIALSVFAAVQAIRRSRK